MPPVDPRLVDITREFLFAHQLVRRLLERYRQGRLRFDELQELVGDGEGSVLFRLKECCHARFRNASPTGDASMTRGALFDLAVGSLFHEAMKLRENFYQLSSYGPKVRALRSTAGPDADRLFEEFEKILAASEERIEEAFQETETLLEQTRQLFTALLAAHRHDGLLARYLIENASLVEPVVGEDLDDFLARIHGSATLGYVLAGDSYLDSGYFEEAERTLEEALRRDPSRVELKRLACYAKGMRAYLEGRYLDALACLEGWLDADPAEEELRFARIAHSALARLGALVEGADGREETERAAILAGRLESWISRADAA